MSRQFSSVPPLAVVALGDPSRRDDGIGPRVMGRVRTLVGEIGVIRARRAPLLTSRREAARDIPSVRPARAQFRDAEQRVLAELSLQDPLPEPPDPARLVEWIEGGTDARRLDPVLGDRRRVVLIDAVRLGTPVGTVHHWHLNCSPNDRLSRIRHFNGRSRMGLAHLALWLEDELPDRGTDLIGIEPYDTGEGDDLSPAVSSRLPAICSQAAAIILRILEEEGW